MFRNLITFRRKRRDDESSSNNIISEEGISGARVVVQNVFFVYKGKNKRRGRTRNNNTEMPIINVITHATIHPSVRHIHKFGFQDCCTSLVRVSIPHTVQHIHKFAFKRCTSLRCVEISQEGGLRTIGSGAFAGCSSLVGTMESSLSENNGNSNNNNNHIRLKLPKTLETIGSSAFSRCTSLANVHFHHEGLYLKTLDCGAFSSCESLVQINNLPIGLQSIGKNAFAWCESLDTVSLPSTVEVIGQRAFVGCKSLVNLRLPQEGLLKTIGERAFGSCTSLLEIDLPPTVVTIDFFAFGHCTSLANVQLQEGLKLIGRNAFFSCTALFAIALPFSLEELGLRAFSDCTSLRTVEFPKEDARGLKIGKNCFYGCKELVNVSLPSYHAPNIVFAGCDRLLPNDGDTPNNDNTEESRLLLHKKRFANLPVHEVCYHSSTASSIPQVMRALGANTTILNNNNNNTILEQNNAKDVLGMTPFHILALCVHPNVKLLQCLLTRYPLDILDRKDRFENTMMDYLLWNTSKKAVSLIQTVLERVIVDRVCTQCGTSTTGGKISNDNNSSSNDNNNNNNNNNNKWRSELTMCLGALQHTDSVENRRTHVQQCFFGTVGHCLRLEMTSMMELALWKMGTREIPEEANDAFRADCRFQCGSEVVIEKVVGYLWGGEESRSATALSTFRLRWFEDKLDAVTE